MTMLLRPAQRAKFIAEVLRVNERRLLAQAPRGVDARRLLSIYFRSIAYDPALAECTPESILGGVFTAMQLGLSLGGPLQEAWLVPFRQKGKPVATLIVGYQGFRNLVDRARAVVDLNAYLVHLEDEWDYWLGDEPRIIHRPRRSVLAEADLRAAYAVARLRGGGKQLVVMPKEEIDAIRRRSPAADKGPWVTDYPEMARKTAVRRLCKLLPKRDELLARALELDEQADRGEQQLGVEDTDLVIPPMPDAEPDERLRQALGVRTEEPAAPADAGADAAEEDDGSGDAGPVFELGAEAPGRKLQSRGHA
jgi:recombination protein RecT